MPRQTAHITDDWCATQAKSQGYTPAADRLEHVFADLACEGFSVRVTTGADLIFFTRRTFRGQLLDSVSFGAWHPDTNPLAKARERYLFVLQKITEGMDAKSAVALMREATGAAAASTFRTALDRHGKYLEQFKENKKLATEAARWPDRRRRIEGAVRRVLDVPLSKLTGDELVKDMRHRYADLGFEKAVSINHCDLLNVMKRNARTQAFPKALVDFLQSDELREEFEAPKYIKQTVSLRKAAPAQWQKAWQHCLDNVHNGYACTHLAAIMTGAHQAELEALRGDWIKEVGGIRVIHFPGWVMKGKHQLDSRVSAENENHVAVTPRLWNLILAHRAAAAVPLDDGLVWLAPGRSSTGGKKPIYNEHSIPRGADSSAHVAVYKAVKLASGLEHWGQRYFRRTFASVTYTESQKSAVSPAQYLAQIEAATALESTLNRKSAGLLSQLSAMTRTHYIDHDAKIDDQVKSSLMAVTLVESWLAGMLGETGDNVVSLEGARG